MQGILIETDLIVEHLTAGPTDTPLLRRLLQVRACFSTFVQAAEIYSAARTDAEVRLVERGLIGLKILGASSRYAKSIGKILSSMGSEQNLRNAIVAAMAIESKLPVVTDLHLSSFSGITDLHIYSASALRTLGDLDELGAALAMVP